MKVNSITVLATLVASVLAVPSSLAAPKVVHEKRDFVPSQWLKKTPVDRKTLLPVKVALKQGNLDRAYDELMAVSDLHSPNYGNHWSSKQVADFFAPAKESVEAVKNWLIESGINEDRISRADGLGWLHFDAHAEEVEDLLNTKYHYYEHEQSGQGHIGCEEYHVPADVQEHIDFITPTLHFDTRVRKGGDGGSLSKRASAPKHGNKPIGGPLHSGPKISLNRPQLNGSTADCGAAITPVCLRALYNLPQGTLNRSSYGIVEYAPETYLQSDLDLFWATPATNDAGVPVGTAPKFEGIDGGYLAPATDASFGINGEPDLDLEYAMDLVYPQQVTLYQVGDNGNNSAMISFNNFLDALDKSYCSYEGGDDPTIDEKFPDPGGYQGKNQCGGFAATKVISTSYAYNEHDLTPFYEMRQCNEYMKLGLQGVSFLYSSGDYGVAGNGGQCIDPKTGGYNNGTSGKFNPSFPGTCPYITSVGATQIPVNGTVTQPETACETVIYSGGGFSNVFPMPSYQSAAVKTYYAKHKPAYGAARYNNTQKVRGFPDVAANGANYVVALDGTFELVYGTSASAPTFGSVVTLLNNERAKKGKKALGFLNPAFYNNTAMFNDITSGGNMGCGTAGFTAVTGWDPVTGLGTPNYTKMLAVLG